MNGEFKRIMIFGRPGSGKSTFAHQLSLRTGTPLYHLDKFFFVSNWAERDTEEFMQMQMEIINSKTWIIDGNSLGSLELRWQAADLVLYFNFNKFICLYRLIKRLLIKSKHIDDRADNCPEKLRFKLIKYMWHFENRVQDKIKQYKKTYPTTSFVEITNSKQLKSLDNIK